MSDNSAAKSIEGETSEDMASETYSLFILKSNAQGLRAGETYLRNRKWIVGSGINMREALAYIIQKHPTYIMICADHPNKKIKILPKLLSQAFPVKIIAYTESSAPSAMTALREMNQTYNLYPPVSGPAIERMILKIKKDEETKALNAHNTVLDPNDPNTERDPVTGVIRLKGENSASGGGANSGFESARAALSQLISSGDSDDNSDGFAMTQEGAKANSFAFNQEGAASGDFGFNQEDTANNNINPNSVASPSNPRESSAHNATPEEDQSMREGETFAEWEERMRKAAEFKAHQAEKKKQQSTDTNNKSLNSANNQNNNQDNNQSDNQTHNQSYNPTGSNNSMDPNKTSQDTSPETEQDYDQDGSPIPRNGRSSSEMFNDPSMSRRKKSAPILESDDIQKKEKKALYVRGEKASSLDRESIVIKGSVEALDSSVVMKEDIAPGQVQQIEKSSNVACITVQSERFSGYLVAALGKNRKIDKDFIEMIKKRLFSFLKANGEVVKDEDSLGLQIKEVEFEDWALKQADFLRKSVHDGDEIAMAFFPHQDVSTSLADSVSEKMYKMSLDELKEDVEIEFDLYIYMPENNKYLLYTPQGQPLYGKQKGRLQEKGVTHMHLRKESIQEVKKYRAQNYLNEKIEAYKAAKKISS